MKQWIDDQVPTESSVEAPIELADTRWQVTHIKGKSVGEVEVTLMFEADGRVHGRSGCNQYFGQWQLDGPMLSLSQLAASKMACEPERMRVEDQFNQLVRTELEIVVQADGRLMVSGDQQAALTAIPLADES